MCAFPKDQEIYDLLFWNVKKLLYKNARYFNLHLLKLMIDHLSNFINFKKKISVEQ